MRNTLDSSDATLAGRRGGKSTYEIAMEPIPSRIAIGKHKRLLVRIPFKHIRAIRNLVEEGQKVLWVGVGASATVEIAVLGIRHMALVILRVEILAVPAGREDHFRTYALGTFLVGQAGKFAVSADAAVTDGLASKVLGVDAFHRVTGEHAEVLGEGNQFVVVWAAAGPILVSVQS